MVKIDTTGTVVENELTLSKEEKAYKSVDIEMKESTEPATKALEEDYMIQRRQMKYTVDHQPNWGLSFLLGFQQYMIMFSGTVAIPVILAPTLCIKDNIIAKGQLLNTMFVVCGVSTLLQIFLGTRLPIIQGGSYVYFAVAAGILKDKCSKDGTYEHVAENGTNVTLNYDPNWHVYMRELQGNLMLGSIIQLLVGGFGLVGLLLKVIGPLTIAVLISIIGLSLAEVAAASASTHWGISMGMVVLVALFSEYLKNVPVPVPTLSFKPNVRYKMAKPKLFSTLSIFLSLLFFWVLCAILTAAGVFKKGQAAYIGDLPDQLKEAQWFYFPYPGQFGMPTVSIGGFVGMSAGVIVGIIESIGDYYACAKLSGAPPPPKYALNRGILLEGVGCLFTGMCGPAIGVTSYSGNIAAIGLTKVGSRRVIFCSALLMIVLGVLGKFAVFFASLPEPIIGGMYIVIFGLLISVGISNLQFVNLTSSRNMFVLGISIYLGLVVPGWVAKNADKIDTGYQELDQLLIVILESGMIIGGGLACFLDNTIPGTDDERGMTGYKLATKNAKDSQLQRDVYWVPGTARLIERVPFLKKLPFVQK